MCVYCRMSKKYRVGRSALIIFFYLTIGKTGNSRARFRNPILVFHLFYDELHSFSTFFVTRIIQSLYYAPAGRYINARMHSLKKSVKPEIVNRYDLWVLRHKIGGAKVFVNNVQWSDQIICCMQYTYPDKYNQT